MEMAYVDGIIRLNCDKVVLVAPEDDAVEAIPFQHSAFASEAMMGRCVTDEEDSDCESDNDDEDDENSVLELNIIRDDARQDDDSFAYSSPLAHPSRNDLQRGRVDDEARSPSSVQTKSTKRSKIFKLSKFFRKGSSSSNSGVNNGVQKHQSLRRNLAFEEGHPHQQKQQQHQQQHQQQQQPPRHHKEHQSPPPQRSPLPSPKHSPTSNNLQDYLGIFQLMCNTAWGDCGATDVNNNNNYCTDGDYITDNVADCSYRDDIKPGTPDERRELHWEDRICSSSDIKHDDPDDGERSRISF